MRLTKRHLAGTMGQLPLRWLLLPFALALLATPATALVMPAPDLSDCPIATRGAKGAAEKVYHYTDEATAELIERSQLGLPGRTTYLTPNGNLSPTQAGVELALPQRNTAEAVFEVSTKALDPSKVSRTGRVTGNVLGRGGGGTEILYEGTIPRGSFTRVR